MIGSNVATFPGVARRVVRDGNEIGNHTFTHVDLLHTPEWQGQLELRLTEVAFASAVGRHSILLRPPYSSEVNAVGVDSLRAWKRVAGGKYLVVLSTLDSDDWMKDRTSQQIVSSALPQGNAGGVILMHDGGGDRSRTVAALDTLITDLQSRGYTFVTASELAHTPSAVAMPNVSATERLQSRALPIALRISRLVTNAFTLFALIVLILAVLRAVILVIVASRHRRRTAGTRPSYTSFVSIVVPAFNEQAGIEATIRSLAASRYPAFELIVVDDGSTDDTVEVARAVVEREQLENVHLVCQANAGKSAALLTGIAQAKGDVIVTVDGDTIFEPDTLALLVSAFADERVGAVAGNTKIANRNGLLGRWQHIEYVMGFNLDRRMYDELGCMPTVPGAIGAFRAEALRDVGGFSADTLAEDTDITMAMHRAGWRVAYEPRAIAWTEAPAQVRDLWRQRYRWSYGTMQSVWKHRAAITEGGPSRRLGRIGLPYLLCFQVALPLLGPAVDVFTLYGLLFLDAKLFIAYWIGFTLLQMAVTAYAFRLDRESYRPMWAVPLQQFFYRQLMYLVVVQSVATATAGVRLRWHKLRRDGSTATYSRRNATTTTWA